MADDGTDDDRTPAERARALIRTADRAVLSTALATDGTGGETGADLAAETGGWPYGSLVAVACDQTARPLLLISGLAVHTKNLARESRASLLYDGTAGLDNPLTGARVTVLGRIEPAEDDGLVARYVARHPDAEAYLGFADFGLYAMAVERAHLVAGFGAIHWIDAADLLAEAAPALAAAERDIVAHMNADHRDALRLYATSLAGMPDGDWLMTGIDPDGLDLRDGGRTARIGFPETVAGPGAARKVLAALANSIRASESR